MRRRNIIRRRNNLKQLATRETITHAIIKNTPHLIVLLKCRSFDCFCCDSSGLEAALIQLVLCTVFSLENENDEVTKTRSKYNTTIKHQIKKKKVKVKKVYIKKRKRKIKNKKIKLN
jgi:hypothetical protein